MTSFGTKGVSTESPYIRMGIQEVTIAKIAAGVNRNEKPFIAVSLYPKGQNPDNVTTFELYYSTENATKYSNIKIAELGSAAVKRKALDEVGGATLEEYANNLNALLAGKSLRMVFQGEEYWKNSQDEKPRVRARWERISRFAEAISTEAEFPVYAETKLVFSEEKDLKRTPKPDPEPEGALEENFFPDESLDA
jgi:hypothetical protein